MERSQKKVYQEDIGYVRKGEKEPSSRVKTKYLQEGRKKKKIISKQT